MQNISYIKNFITMTLLTLAGVVSAQVTPLVSPTPAVGSMQDFAEVILRIIIKISIPVLAVYFIYTGFLFVSAQGNTTKLEEARRMFLWGCVGAVVVLGSIVIASLIWGTLGQIMY